MSGTLKINVVGDDFVGKTSLVLQFIDGVFTERVHPYNFDFKRKELDLGDQIVGLNVFDVPPATAFRRIPKWFFDNTAGIIIMYDVTNQQSFENIKFWLQEIEKVRGEPIKIIVGNKCDLVTERKVDFKKAKAWTNNLGIPIFDISAKNNIGIMEIFMYLASQGIKNNLQYPIVEEEKESMPSRVLSSVARRVAHRIMYIKQ